VGSVLSTYLVKFQYIIKPVVLVILGLNDVCCLGRITTGPSGLSLAVKRKGPAVEDDGKMKRPATSSSKTKQAKQKISVLEEIMQVGLVSDVVYKDFTRLSCQASHFR